MARVGVGSMIIFMALLLLAGIVAYVLITTNAMLGEQAAETHKLTKNSLTRSIMIKEVSATDGRTGAVEHFRVITKLLPGSSPINVQRMSITLTQINQTTSYQYKEGLCIANSTTGYYTIKPT